MKKQLIVLMLCTSNFVFGAVEPTYLPGQSDRTAFERYGEIKSPVRRVQPLSIELVNSTKENLHITLVTIDGQKHRATLTPSPEPQRIEFPGVPFDSLKHMQIQGRGRTKTIPQKNLSPQTTLRIKRPAVVEAGFNRFGERTPEILSGDYEITLAAAPPIPERRSPVRLRGADGRERGALAIPAVRTRTEPAPADIRSPMRKPTEFSFFNDTEENLIATVVTTQGEFHFPLTATQYSTVRRSGKLQQVGFPSNQTIQLPVPIESIQEIRLSGPAPEPYIIPKKEVREHWDKTQSTRTMIYQNAGYMINRLTEGEPGDRDAHGRLIPPRKADTYFILPVLRPQTMQAPKNVFLRPFTPESTGTPESSPSSQASPVRNIGSPKISSSVEGQN